MQSKLVVATRVHRASSASLTDVSKVIKFIDQCRSYSNGLIICVDVKESLEDTQYFNAVSNEINSYIAASATDSDSSVKYDVSVIPISTWGNFTFALNAALYKATECKYEYILFQSIEFRISQEFVRRLEQEILIPNTLVVGPFMNGHEFYNHNNPSDDNNLSTAVVPLRGRTCPWNTMAIWNVSLLGLTGFPMIGDGMGEDWGGVEEVSAVALQQLIRPSLRAVLVKFRIVNDISDKPIIETVAAGTVTTDSQNNIDAATDSNSSTNNVASSTTVILDSSISTTYVPSSSSSLLSPLNSSDQHLQSLQITTVTASLQQELTWDTDFQGDEIRRVYHERKMMSKDTRPQKQLEKLGLPANTGTVHHIEIKINQNSLLSAGTT